MIYDVIIVGAGASGLMCANKLSKKLKVLILEKNSTPGKKLLITGGGRCNLTNLKDVKSFLNEVNYNKKYLYSTMYNCSPEDIYSYFKSEVSLKEEEDNKIFPSSNKASDILNFLVRKVNGEINYNESVKNIVVDNYYILETNKGKYKCRNLVIATGGASYPLLGSSGDHILFSSILKQPVTKLFPAETSIILKKKYDLAGTALDEVIVKGGNYQKEGNLMFTHNGLSGTSIMKISEFVFKDKIKKLEIDLLPNMNENELVDIFQKNLEKQPISVLNNYFTKRFSNHLIILLKIDKQAKFKNLTKTKINDIINIVKKYQVEVIKVNDISKAYVTGGGINLDYLNTKSFESKINNNLYFIGECLDVHGPIGGYNLTLAMSTAVSAAIDINNKEN